MVRVVLVIDLPAGERDGVTVVLRQLRPSLRAAMKSCGEGVKREYGQANTGPWWMPRSCLAKKVVVSCEKPRGGAHIPRSADDRMG